MDKTSLILIVSIPIKESVQDVPRNLPLKFHQNRVSKNPIVALRLGWGLNKKLSHILYIYRLVFLPLIYYSRSSPTQC